MKIKQLSFGVLIVSLIILAASISDVVLARDAHRDQSGNEEKMLSEGTFKATREKSFPVLMDESMAVMRRGMQQASRTGDPDHDFVTMMIPHHQGAVDMAKVLLLYGKDRKLRKLAHRIIRNQRHEILLMKAWLKSHPPVNKGD